MKSDEQLKNDVMAELAWDKSINANAIGVGVKDGVVTLSGHLETYAEKAAVQKALRRVAGVKAIAVELDVLLSPDHRRSDTEIAAVAGDVLGAHVTIPSDRIRVEVDKGWITLHGEVDWEFQRRAAERALRTLAGVVGISNEIALKSRPTVANIEDAIEAALVRQADREAHHVQVAVQGGTVWLRGKVHSWQERDAAQGAAWQADGVRTVFNELVVD